MTHYEYDRAKYGPQDGKADSLIPDQAVDSGEMLSIEATYHPEELLRIVRILIERNMSDMSKTSLVLILEQWEKRLVHLIDELGSAEDVVVGFITGPDQITRLAVSAKEDIATIR